MTYNIPKCYTKFFHRTEITKVNYKLSESDKKSLRNIYGKIQPQPPCLESYQYKRKSDNKFILILYILIVIIIFLIIYKIILK